MCFAPEAEAEFFGALRAGQFDVHAVCSSVDADLATATEPADKAMIADRIRQEVGMADYNSQLRSFLEAEYALVAMDQRRGSVAVPSTGAARGELHEGATSQSASESLLAEVLAQLQHVRTRVDELQVTQLQMQQQLGEL